MVEEFFWVLVERSFIKGRRDFWGLGVERGKRIWILYGGRVSMVMRLVFFFDLGFWLGSLCWRG